jgi:4'-phosphopantetheinyl transferase EntD
MNIEALRFDSVELYLFNTNEELSLRSEKPLREWFSEADFESWKDIKSEKRKLEFVGVRYMLFRLGFKGMLYYEGKIPKLKSGAFISISHSGSWVIVAVCRDFPVGVDIELIQEKISRIYDKFVHAEERCFFDSKSLENSTLLWSFKETVYKLMQIEGLSFSQQICIKTTGNQNFKAEISTSSGIFEVHLGHRKIGDYVLTFNVADVQETK